MPLNMFQFSFLQQKDPILHVFCSHMCTPIYMSASPPPPIIPELWCYYHHEIIMRQYKAQLNVFLNHSFCTMTSYYTVIVKIILRQNFGIIAPSILDSLQLILHFDKIRFVF